MTTPDTPNPYDELWSFPCDFPVKAMGFARDDFAQGLCEALHPHIGEVHAHQMELRASKEGRYVSLTITFQATSREHIDAVYLTLTGHPWVKMVF